MSSFPAGSPRPAGSCPAPSYHRYLAHVGLSVPLRRLARGLGHHPSTLARTISRVEAEREDRLLDHALDRAAARLPERQGTGDLPLEEIFPMVHQALSPDTLTDAQVEREAGRILRRLSESTAFLAVTSGLDKAVIFRTASGRMTRIATCPVEIAEAFRLRDWIAVETKGRVMRYVITSAGRAALKRLLAGDAAAKRERREGDSPFAAQHRDEAPREVMEADGTTRTLTVNLAESPLAALARRKGPDGKPFLSGEELEAGERLREAFERAQMGPRVGQNWDRFLVPADGVLPGGDGLAGPQDARDRVTAALAALGPGLGDIALRCCCFLEGLEAAEKRLGWSARSGKVVLKIALGRLARHYGISRIAA
ncbi:DUF6456 domain-containing protein [Pontivivens ytuae]|uniref:Helix-turn-helix domain-containing protein n=1 Tax=Pontivivens ytuae TaxID=2789856 RepID=A0A7S9LT22_9RHOB|nr:DUF6456 domain-containing protein [Pontivivens ytuae]QPH54766.1 helix-turn-helix domain-containing protein [Pontivivens ytuae]